jgi:hypothetical protein
MRVIVPVPKDCALACIMMELYFNNGKLDKMNAKIFRKMCATYMFGNGEQSQREDSESPNN